MIILKNEKDLIEKSSFEFERFGFSVNQIDTKENFLKLFGLPDFINLTPILFNENMMYIKKEWLPDYSESYVQLYGDDIESMDPIDPTYPEPSDTDFSKPIKYSEWINKEIEKKCDMIHNLSDNKFEYNCQEVFQRLDYGGVIIGLDVWKTDLQTGKSESFSVLTKAYLYQGAVIDMLGSSDLSKADIKELEFGPTSRNPIYQVIGEWDRPNIFYKIQTIFYKMYNKFSRNRSYRSNLDYRLD